MGPRSTTTDPLDWTPDLDAPETDPEPFLDPIDDDDDEDDDESETA